MAKTAKIGDKLVKVSESFTVNMYDNGFMIEVSGRNKDDDYTTAKVIISDVDELLGLVKEITTMTKDQ